LTLKRRRDRFGMEFVLMPKIRGTIKKEGFSYEYHYRTKDGLALTDFKITTCEK